MMLGTRDRHWPSLRRPCHDIQMPSANSAWDACHGALRDTLESRQGVFYPPYYITELAPKLGDTGGTWKSTSWSWQPQPVTGTWLCLLDGLSLQAGKVQSISSDFILLGVQNFKVVTFLWLVCYNPRLAAINRSLPYSLDSTSSD